VLHIIKKFAELSGKNIKIIFKKKREGDMAAIINNPNLIKKTFGKMGNTTLNDIIKTSLMWEKFISNK
jgi:UDP-glucose 4-epimerase